MWRFIDGANGKSKLEHAQWAKESLHHVPHLEALQELHDDLGAVSAQVSLVKRRTLFEEFVVLELLSLEDDGGVVFGIAHRALFLLRERVVDADARLVLGERRGDERDAEGVRDLDHRLGKRFRIVDDDAHGADDVRGADRLVACEGGEQQHVVRVIEQHVAHQVVRDDRADRARARPVAGHQLSVQHLHHIRYRHIGQSFPL